MHPFSQLIGRGVVRAFQILCRKKIRLVAASTHLAYEYQLSV